MKFLIVTHVQHIYHEGKYYAYGPYVKEMNLWTSKVDQVLILAPLAKSMKPTAIDLAYHHSQIQFINVPEINFTTLIKAIRSVLILPWILFVTGQAMLKANHIHLRCPGNMGLIGSLAQLIFPWKNKTAKYAGNWDRNSKQPYTYKLQQRIITSALTRNMKVLVYGIWKNEPKQVVGFFTASYRNQDKAAVLRTALNRKIKLMYAGALEPGKHPEHAITIAKTLVQKGFEVILDLYGDGSMRQELHQMFETPLQHLTVQLHGNVNQSALKVAYISHDFLILLSESEGWPKVVAESMWWGCIPVSTPVSCVPWMLQQGEAGILANDCSQGVHQITELITSPTRYINVVNKSIEFARTYTLEKMEAEIQTLISS